MTTIDNKVINRFSQKKIICRNVLIMMSERKLLDKDKIDSIYNTIIKKINELSYFECKLNNNKNLLVHFIDIKITSIKKIDNIDKIINNKKYNIFIINNIQNKIWEQLISYNIEVFYNYEFMINLIDHDIVPEHKLLSKEEENDFIKLYNNEISNLPKILLYDPISRYYNSKIGDIFRIKRPNISSGYSIFYRVVVNGSLPEIKQ